MSGVGHKTGQKTWALSKGMCFVDKTSSAEINPVLGYLCKKADVVKIYHLCK